MRHSKPKRVHRRGSTMILVVSMLVLLVIIAAAFVSRAQSLRVLSSAQQLTAAQTDRVGAIAHEVTQEIAQSLFVQPANSVFSVDERIPDVSNVVVPGTLFIPAFQTRYGVDPRFPFNFAPFEVRPWTNWPDNYSLRLEVSPNVFIEQEGNPEGNPGFGDTRWLRSTEPVRVQYDFDGNPNTPLGPTFSHWAHLSWIPTPNNGWLLVPDISNLGNALTGDLGLGVPYEQWLPSRIPSPNNDIDWLKINLTSGPFGFTTPALAATTFQALAFGSAGFDGWFSNDYERAVLGEDDLYSPLPNFLRLKWFGQKADEFITNSPRNIITRTLCDTDGDGFTDSFWFLAPTSIDRSIRHVVGVSVVDNSALLNVNIATRFDLATTGGKTPSDLALVGRLSSFPPDLSGEAGYLDSQLNTALNGEYPSVTVAFDRERFGSPTYSSDGANPPSVIVTDPLDNTKNQTFLSEIGVVTTAPAPVAIEAFPNFLTSDFDRTKYFKAMSSGGEVEGYFAADGTAVVRTDSRAPAILDPFTMADELELRSFHGQNNPYVRSRLERALESDIKESPAGVSSSDYSNQFLRSAMNREETSEFFDQLDARQLLFDNRRKLTTVSGARNDLMPPWLWTMPPLPVPPSGGWQTGNERKWSPIAALGGVSIPITSPPVPLASAPAPSSGPNPFLQFPNQGGAGSLPGDANCDSVVDFRDYESARIQFLKWNQKVDLNRELTPDLTPGANQETEYAIDQIDFGRDFLKVALRSFVDDFNQKAIFSNSLNWSRLRTISTYAAASWAANIMAARDGSRVETQFSAQVQVDPPCHPKQGIIVQAQGPPLGQPTVLETVSFIGQEKHPFIVQVFLAVVYPKTGKNVQNSDEENFVNYKEEVPACDLKPGQLYQIKIQGNTNWISIGAANNSLGTKFVKNTVVPTGRGTAYKVFVDPARVVLAVQIANPYNEPISLQPFKLKAFGQEFFFSDNSEWGYGIAPMLGPATEEKPCSAIIFAIPKEMSLGDGTPYNPGENVPDYNQPNPNVPNQCPLYTKLPIDRITVGNFGVSMLDMLDLTHSWFIRGYPDPIVPFPKNLDRQIENAMDNGTDPFPANLPGGNPFAADLYEEFTRGLNPPAFVDSSPAVAETMLFNVSKPGIVTAGNFIVGQTYKIKQLVAPIVGAIQTNFIEIGASQNVIGNTFIATGPGTGTGEAWEEDYAGVLLSQWSSGRNRWSVIPQDYADKLKAYIDASADFLNADPLPAAYVAYNAAVSGVTIELIRTIPAAPTTAFASAQVVVDRFPNNRFSFSLAAGDGNPADAVNDIVPNQIYDIGPNAIRGEINSMKEWTDELTRLLDDRSVNGQGELTSSVPEPFTPPNAEAADPTFDRISIINNDFLMTWTRASRPWTLDVDNNGSISENERSPRFVFPFCRFAANAAEVAWDPIASNTLRKPTQTPVYPKGKVKVGVSAGPDEFYGRVFTLNYPGFQGGQSEDPDGILNWGNQTPFAAIPTLNGKPTHFTLLTRANLVDGHFNSVYEAWPDPPDPNSPELPWEDNPVGLFGGQMQLRIYGDTGVGRPPLSLDFYQHPLQMSQRDGSFEQVAEILDVPVWGPLIKFSLNGTLFTYATYGEMMVGDRFFNAVNAHIGNEFLIFPAGARKLNGNPFLESVDQGDISNQLFSRFPTFVSERGGQGAREKDTMRFQFDRNQDASFRGGPFVPFLPNGFLPTLPFGASILDGLTLDDAGPTVPIQLSDPDYLEQLLTLEQRRLRLASSFSSSKTNGLINVNTAPIEVLRALPNLQQLSYNSELSTADGRISPPRSRLPESIANYRDRFPTENPDPSPVWDFLDGPKYDDRGFKPAGVNTELFRFHPGMRAERGFVSIGELGLIDREYRQSNIQTAEIDPEDTDDVSADWNYNKSWSVAFPGRDPYRTEEDLPLEAPPVGGHIPPIPPLPISHDGSGWRSTVLTQGLVSLRHSAQLPTERLAQQMLSSGLSSSSLRIAGDTVERNALLKGIANIVTTRSDVFTVYLKIRSVSQNASTGLWDATNPETLIDESRYIVVVDRSGVNRPGDEPKILMFEKIVD